jgi:crotonobetainyl-CoA:carnitine CoA-transferase CaiB-like acyl-CoA transferase
MIRLVAPPWKTSLPAPPLKPPPLLGNDQDEVLQEWLGVGARTVNA